MRPAHHAAILSIGHILCLSASRGGLVSEGDVLGSGGKIVFRRVNHDTGISQNSG
jgi:hypothetical protein